MLSLILATVAMGILDSFNPVALTQQFCLQGMVKKRRHILCFSGSVGITNLIGGLVIYYGLGQVVARFWGLLSDRYFWVLPACEIILGILAWAYVVHRHLNRKITESLGAQITACEKEFPSKCADGIKSVHLIALCMLGAFAVICELPTSLPYFAFLAILLQYELSLPALVGVLVLYNLLFTAPLFLMYILYMRWQDKVDRLYLFLKNKLYRYGTVLLPVLAALIGIVAIFHACFLIFSR